MKILLIIFSWAMLVQTSHIQNTHNNSVSTPLISEQTANIDFEKEIKPIFVKNCSPCHFPGGKMYDKLPFDKDTTILNHSASILKRIKNEAENTLLKEYILQNKNGLFENKPH